MKIIKLKKRTDEILSFIDDIRKLAEDKNIESIMFTAKTSDNDIYIGKCNVDIPRQFELLGELHANIIKDTIR